MEPATTLPSDDEPWWQTVEEFDRRLAPLEPHFKIQLARRLSEEFAQPQAGLSKLGDAEPLLEPSQRGAWLGEKGLGLLALGRDAEAVECFRELAGPERLTRMREWDY